MDNQTRNRFFEKVNTDENTGCWNWIGAKTSGGYGNFAIKKVNFVAHRVSYELVNGEIPEGLHLDHLCRNRACVNPEHLEPVTQRVNLLRGETIPALHSAKTHCPSGHEYSEENTLIYRGSRHCKTCRAIRNNYNNAERKRRKKEGA
jgi:hypothetical protein